MIRLMLTTAVAVALAAPAMAQSERQDRQQGQAQQQQMSTQARACVDDLQQLDQRLAEIGYGRAGPRGYGIYGAPYAGAPAPTAGARTDGGTGALAPTERTSPRADMYTLMRAGYLMAQNGYDQGCQEVVAAVRDIGNRYEEAIRTGDMSPDQMRQWRGERLAAAVPVSQLDRPMRTDEIIGADVRTMQDEDLGDIEDVVLGADGSVRYVIVSTGGFLGLGEQDVPVRWQDLRVTTEPYRETFVLDVSEQTFENAPRLDDRDPASLAEGAQSDRLESFWDDAKIGEQSRQ